MAGSRERGVASKVVNLDFSASALAIGRVNANLNGFEDFGGAVVDASSGLQGDVTAALRAPLPSLR
jgi:23S rRNA G2069 N7-methylase RlmK/C1962 C5-methylase RlmI